MKPVLEDTPMGPMASPSISQGLRFRWEDSRRRVRVVFGGITIADSTRVMLLHEFGRLPVFYFPLEDVRMELSPLDSAGEPARQPYQSCGRACH